MKKLISKVGINKVRIVATLATKENQSDLAEKVKTMSKTALELFAREQRAPKETPPGRERSTVSFSLDKDVEFKLRKFKNKMGDAVEWNDVIKELLEKAEKPVGKVRKARKTKKTKKITRYICVETKNRLPEKCQYPGCNLPAQVIHHPERFSLQANHNNLKPLCKGHHELAHNGFEPEEWSARTHKPIEQKYIDHRSIQ